MPDLLDQQHVDAFMSLLRADATLVSYPDAQGFTPVIPAAQYVRVHSTIDRPIELPGNALAGLSQAWVARYICHCVGANEYASTAIVMRVRAAVLDQRPTIGGRNCGLFREEQALPPTKDFTTGADVFDSLVVFRLTTN